MGLHINDFKTYVVTPTLQYLDNEIPYSIEAEQLVLGTCHAESRLAYLKQIGGGPALGVCQIEPDTYNDIWQNFLTYDAELADRVSNISGGWPMGPAQLIGNLNFAAAMCRVHYWRAPDPLPAPGDAQGMGECWKKIYNTPAGAGTVEKFAETFEEFVLPLYA